MSTNNFRLFTRSVILTLNGDCIEMCQRSNRRRTYPRAAKKRQYSVQYSNHEHVQMITDAFLQLPVWTGNDHFGHLRLDEKENEAKNGKWQSGANRPLGQWVILRSHRMD